MMMMMMFIIILEKKLFVLPGSISFFHTRWKNSLSKKSQLNKFSFHRSQSLMLCSPASRNRGKQRSKSTFASRLSMAPRCPKGPKRWSSTFEIAVLPAAFLQQSVQTFDSSKSDWNIYREKERLSWLMLIHEPAWMPFLQSAPTYRDMKNYEGHQPIIWKPSTQLKPTSALSRWVASQLRMWCWSSHQIVSACNTAGKDW